MKIIIVGCGKVGTTIAEELYHEGHDITVIDQNAATVQTITENIDAVSYTHLDVYKRQVSRCRHFLDICCGRLHF